MTASPLRRPYLLDLAERDVDVVRAGQVAGGADERVVVEDVEDAGDRARGRRPRVISGSSASGRRSGRAVATATALAVAVAAAATAAAAVAVLVVVVAEACCGVCWLGCCWRAAGVALPVAARPRGLPSRPALLAVAACRRAPARSRLASRSGRRCARRCWPRGLPVTRLRSSGGWRSPAPVTRLAPQRLWLARSRGGPARALGRPASIGAVAVAPARGLRARSAGGPRSRRPARRPARRCAGTRLLPSRAAALDGLGRRCCAALVRRRAARAARRGRRRGGHAARGAGVRSGVLRRAVRRRRRAPRERPSSHRPGGPGWPSTRSDLRIRAVPLMPSSAATACSSGRRAPRDRRPRPLAPSALRPAGAISVVSVTKDPSPSRPSETPITVERDEAGHRPGLVICREAQIGTGWQIAAGAAAQALVRRAGLRLRTHCNAPAGHVATATCPADRRSGDIGPSWSIPGQRVATPPRSPSTVADRAATARSNDDLRHGAATRGTRSRGSTRPPSASSDGSATSSAPGRRRATAGARASAAARRPLRTGRARARPGPHRRSTAAGPVARAARPPARRSPASTGAPESWCSRSCGGRQQQVGPPGQRLDEQRGAAGVEGRVGVRHGRRQHGCGRRPSPAGARGTSTTARTRGSHRRAARRPGRRRRRSRRP